MSLLSILSNIFREDAGLGPVGYRGLEDGFGFGMYPGDIHRQRIASSPNSSRRRFSPYEKSHQMLRGKIDPKENPTVGKDGFQVCMDVSHFKPNELTVKTVGNFVVVEGKHEEREDDHGFISRSFVRKYHLPKGYDAKDVVSTVSTDGVLTVKAPPPPKALKNNERIIQIQETGPAHMSVKQNEDDDAKQVQNNSAGKKTEAKQ